MGNLLNYEPILGWRVTVTVFGVGGAPETPFAFEALVCFSTLVFIIFESAKTPSDEYERSPLLARRRDVVCSLLQCALQPREQF